jgi:putative ABC transport system substrate-binding protein
MKAQTATLIVVALALGMLMAPLAADAQQAAKVPRIGFLCPLSKPGGRLRALQQGLRELGYVDGQNIAIETRFAEQRYERFPDLAADLVRLGVDVIVPMGEAALRAVHEATRTIPIVMPGDGGDPVEDGFVASLGRPGGNVTGLTRMSPELSGKRLELLKEALPKLSRVAYLWNPAIPANTLAWRETQLAAQQVGVRVQFLEVREPTELENVLQTALRGRAEALIVPRDPTFSGDPRQILEFAAKNRLPAIYELRDWVDMGGLISYGPHWNDLYRRSATYIVKILHGAKPADLPVEQPTKFELVVNLRTARALGLKIPQSILIRADQVIQ